MEKVYQDERHNMSEVKMIWELYKTQYEKKQVHQSLNDKTPKKLLEQTRKLAI